MALSYNRTYVENQSTGKALEGVVVRVYKDNVLQNVFADESSTPLPTVLTGEDGSATYYVDGDGVYEEEYVYNGDILDRVKVPIFNPANYAPGADVDAIIGAPAVDGDLGTFTSALIDDNVSTKAAIESVATNLGASGGSAFVGFQQGGSGPVSLTAEAKMRQTVTAEDFGALGDGSGDLIGASATGAAWNVWPSWINDATYGTKPGHDYGDGAWLAANPPFSATDTKDFVAIQLALWFVQGAGGGTVKLTGTDYVVSRPVRFVMGADGIGVDLVGNHPQKCQIRPLTTLAPITGIGSAVIYGYRLGLSGCSIRNVGVTTFPKIGGTPVPEFDSEVVTANWETAGTYKACIMFLNCDTVNVLNVFASGYGEAGIVGLNQSSINIDNFVTEFQSCSVLLRGGSNAYITDSILFNSSGTGASSWGASAVCLESSKAYVSGGQITFMRKYAVLGVGTNNEFTLDDLTIYTENFGLLFKCKGLVKWRIANCFMTYGLPNQTPITLLDNQDTGSGDALSADSTGTFTGNIVDNAGGTSTYDIMRVNGTYLRITDNSFDADATGASTGNFVINGLINGSFSGAGTSKCIFSNNNLKNFSMAKVSLIGTKQDNIDSVGTSILTGTAYPGLISVTTGATGSFTVTVTGVAIDDIITGVTYQLPNLLAGVAVTANITSANTVTVQAHNVSASTVNLSNELWTVYVQRKACL
jgi:hypothetical protein